jgi:hypothetical protein
VSIQEEHELRNRLEALLYSVEPGPAPVAGVMRQGKGIRTRRWISAAAGVAVLAVCAVVLPGVLRGQPAAPLAPQHYKVTVIPVRPGSRPGLIGQGITDGHRWTAIMTAAGSEGVMLTGRGVPAVVSYQSLAEEFAANPASLMTSGSGGPVLEFGTVQTDVTRVAIKLPDGEVLNLAPVSWRGRSWVAVQLPAGVRIVRAVLYTSRGELAYAVPFRDTELDIWWQPGQVGPARLTKTIGSGVVDGQPWRAAADIGPWGYCYTLTAGTDCIDTDVSPELLPARTLVSPMICGSIASAGASAPKAGFGAAAPAVARVVLRYSGGGTAAFPTVVVGGGRMFGYSIPGGHKVTGSREYRANGQLLGSTGSAAWVC